MYGRFGGFTFPDRTSASFSIGMYGLRITLICEVINFISSARSLVVSFMLTNFKVVSNSFQVFGCKVIKLLKFRV